MTFQLSDGTQYRRMNDGSVRRDPPKLGGRERKRLRKARGRRLGKRREG